MNEVNGSAVTNGKRWITASLDLFGPPPPETQVRNLIPPIEAPRVVPPPKGKRPLPMYLARPERVKGQHVWGELRYDEADKRWEIHGEPAVCEMAKRLFPGSEGRGQGVAKFPATKRAAGDLNWLMIRFPLRVRKQDREAWEKAREDAIEHTAIRMYKNRAPKREPTPPTFNGKLYGFQEEGLSYLLNNERCLLADGMGTGKTPTALAWLTAQNAYPAVVVVQPHLVRQWESETRKFLPGVTIHTIKGLKPHPLPRAQIYLIHYLLLRGWKEELPALHPRAVVFDEIQEFRHDETEKYSAGSLLAGASPRVVGLSGTPIYNHGGEMWKVLNIIDYHCLGDYDSFSREWCHGYGSDIIADPVLFGDYLRREGLMLRRTKDDVLSELPPKRRVIEHIDVDRGLYDSLIGDAVKLAVQSGLEKEAFERGRLVREAINESRRVTGLAKARYVCAFVRALLEAGETVLLFAYHHDVWREYGEQLKDFSPVRVTGMETPAQKADSIKAFMEDEFTNLCMVSLRAASGLNLQRANCVVFGELDWSPAVHSQAEDRAHRIGQKDSVLCYYLVCDEGTDQDMTEALGLKVSQFLGIMGDKSESEEDRAVAQFDASEHMKRVIDRLKERGKK